MRNLFLFTTLILGLWVNGQDLWSLESCITYAHEHNIQIRQSELSIESADISKDASWANVFPNLNLNTGYYWTFGKSIDPITNIRLDRNQQTSSMTLSSSWVIFNGFQNYKGIKRAQLDKMAALYNLESMKNDITLQVTSQYLQVLLNKEVLLIAENQYDISYKLVTRTEQLFNAGSVPKSELLQAQARLASDDQSIVSAQNNEMLSLLQLAQLLQLDSISNFDIIVPEVEVPSTEMMAYTSDQIYGMALEKQPQIQAANLNVESSKQSLSISKGGAYPTLSLQAQLNTNYANSVLQGQNPITIYQPNPYYTDPFDDNSPIDYYSTQTTLATEFDNKSFGSQFQDNVNQYIGLNLSIPIFNNFNNRSNVRNAQISLTNAELSLESEKLAFKQTIQRAHADSKAAYKSYLASEKSAEANEISWSYAQSRNEAGAMNQYDYENARFQYLQAMSNMLQSKYDFIFKIKVLEFYINNNIAL